MAWADTATGNSTDIGWANGGPSSGIGQNTTGLTYGLNQGSLTAQTVALSSLGFLYGQRKAASGAGATELYRAEPTDSSAPLFASASTASTSLTSGAINVGAIAGSNFAGKRLSAASIGKSMSAADITKFFLRIKTYMAAIGNT